MNINKYMTKTKKGKNSEVDKEKGLVRSNSRTLRNSRGARKFRQQIHSRKGMVVTALSVCLILWYLAFVAYAFWCKGSLSAMYGCIGFLAVILSVVCLFQAISSKTEVYRFPLFPNLALAGSAVSCILWIGTYCLGIFL